VVGVVDTVEVRGEGLSAGDCECERINHAPWSHGDPGLPKASVFDVLNGSHEEGRVRLYDEALCVLLRTCFRA
jgi:hypothetical protein